MSWSIITASVAGRSHIEDNKPCQDSYKFKLIDDYCGIAIIADGAGSCEHSHIGSQFVVRVGIKLYEKLIIKNNWNNLGAEPSSKEWRDESIVVAMNISKALEVFSKKECLNYKSLSSTLIVTFFSKKGIYSLNIGDGRGAFKNDAGEWKSIVTPHHGEQVGMTIFLTSPEIWANLENYIYTSVFDEPIVAFIILSDGYEKITFSCYEKDEKGIYSDPNIPFSEFLNFKLNHTKVWLKTKSLDQINEKWNQFLVDGNTILEKEDDDKTMIFGLYL